jgi:hypothetical protein
MLGKCDDEVEGNCTAERAKQLHVIFNNNQ